MVTAIMDCFFNAILLFGSPSTEMLHRHQCSPGITQSTFCLERDGTPSSIFLVFFVDMEQHIAA